MSIIDLPAMKKNKAISRRDFIRVSGIGATAFFTPGLLHQHFHQRDRMEADIQTSLATMANQGLLNASGRQEWAPHNYGRVIDAHIEVFDAPSFTAKRIEFLWKDAVVPLLGIHYNEETDSHNRVWYQVSGTGFAHSGAIQPVNTILNEASNEIPRGGRLAEVTVPFTDSFWAPGVNQPLAYRFYYETTHWVVDMVYDAGGEPWYMLIEDKWDLRYYARARHLRLIPSAELSPLSAQVPSQLKRLEIYLPQQYLVAYEDNVPIFMTRVASGGKFIDGNFTTQAGHYITFHKRPSRHMAAGNLAAGGYDLPGVPWISYFTESGISFHGTYWHNNFGRPRSHGCVNLSIQAAKWVYRWTLPVVPYHEQRVYENFGTSILIYDS
jgi:hypothetical protein